ncbi:hypothetical protein VPH35_076523 [Triticum aestivum]|uniref:Uncharacterized protein n=1 Tax=Aegilops tauschii TaxID=37682 RepID=M8C7N0_AEGTA
MALSHAVKLADQLGVGRVLFETDRLNLQQAVTSNSGDFAPLGQMFQDLKAKLSTQFIRAGVVHVSRDCNKPAHVLAATGAGLANGEMRLWLDNFPADVTRYVTGSFALS